MAPSLSRDREAEMLSRYREALMTGAPAAELASLAAEIDPELVATVRWSMSEARNDRPQPDSQFVQRLRADLVGAAGASGTTEVAPSSVPYRRATVDGIQPLQAPRAWPHRTWGAIAAAVLIVLIGGGLLLQFLLSTQPAAQLTAPGAPVAETLVDSEITGDEDAWLPLSVETWRLQPGATLTLPLLEGPQWIVADTGPLTVTVDGVASPLVAGASVMVPEGLAAEVRNTGLAEVSLFRGMAGTGFSLPLYEQDSASRGIAFETEAHESLPPGVSRLVFERLTIPPGTTLKLETATGLNWFDIVSGRLGLTLIGEDLPPGWESERERDMATDESVPVLVPGTRIWLHNLGDDVLTVLSLRVEAHSETEASGT